MPENGRGQLTRVTRARLIDVIAGLVAGLTVAEAAKLAGMPKRTADRALARPEVKAQLDAAYAKAQGEAVRMARQRIVAATPTAVETLLEICRTSDDPHARVKAATSILDRGGLHARQELRLGHAVEELTDAQLLGAAREAERVLADHAKLLEAQGAAGDTPLLEGDTAPVEGDTPDEDVVDVSPGGAPVPNSDPPDRQSTSDGQIGG